MTTLDTPHEAPPTEVRLAPAAGGELLIEQFDATTYDLYVTDETSERAMVRITRETLIELLELVGSVLAAAVRGRALNESIDMIDVDELVRGAELYAAYCAEDPDEATPEGLQVEAIESHEEDSLVIVALTELPQLQLQLTSLLLSADVDQ